MGIILTSSVDVFFKVIYFAILIRIILSWVPIGRDSIIVQFIYTVTEPILAPIRNMIDRSPIGGGMMLDFSPVIALFFMNIAKLILITMIQTIF